MPGAELSSLSSFNKCTVMECFLGLGQLDSKGVNEEPCEFSPPLGELTDNC